MVPSLFDDNSAPTLLLRGNCREKRNPLPPCTPTSPSPRGPPSNHRAGFHSLSLPRQAIGWLEDFPMWGARDRNGGGGRVVMLGSFCRNTPHNRRVGAESSSNNLCRYHSIYLIPLCMHHSADMLEELFPRYQLITKKALFGLN